jgi:peptide/nickel transport system substrate-binding protein
MKNVWGQTVVKPQYGGTIVISNTFDPSYADPFFGWEGNYEISGVLETLLLGNYALPPEKDDFSLYYIPLIDTKGNLAESWEQPDPTTLIWHIRKGVYWQNKPPVNGREFTAADVEYHWSRMLGLGYGFTQRSPYDARTANLPITSVKATDKYTVVMKGAGFTFSHIEFIGYVSWVAGPITPKEVIDKYGDAKDWRNVVGTGPWMIGDHVDGSSWTYTKNPNYWGTDERYPGMKLPFADVFKVLIMPDVATRMAAMRTGKIDTWSTSLQADADAMKKSNPEIPNFLVVSGGGGWSMNVTKPPFNDVRVRKAMIMAINYDELVKGYFKGYAESTIYGMFYLPVVKGFGVPPDQWPADVKAGYSYDPAGAKKLLVDAGYPNGFKFTFDYATGSDIDYATYLKSYWAAIGVTCDINMIAASVLNSRAIAGTHGMTQRGYRSALTYPTDRISNYTTGNSENYPHWSDANYDSIVKQATSVTDYTQFQDLVKQANAIWTAAFLDVPLPMTKAWVYTQPWIMSRGTNTNIGGGNFWAIYARWWIDQDKKKSLGH